MAGPGAGDPAPGPAAGTARGGSDAPRAESARHSARRHGSRARSCSCRRPCLRRRCRPAPSTTSGTARARGPTCRWLRRSPRQRTSATEEQSPKTSCAHGVRALFNASSTAVDAAAFDPRIAHMRGDRAGVGPKRANTATMSCARAASSVHDMAVPRRRRWQATN